MTYKHLSETERYQIFCLMREGLSCTEIAKNLARSKSTISREIVRKKGGRGYRPKQADRFAEERSVVSHNARRIDPDVLKAAFERNIIKTKDLLEIVPKIHEDVPLL